MPLTHKGETILKAMMKHYGTRKAKRVFYASATTKTITGVHK